MIRWGIVRLVLLVGPAGCSAGPSEGPTPQESPAPVMVKNNATQIQTFTVAVAPVESRITVHLEGNVTHRIAFSKGSSTIRSKVPILRIELPKSARTHGNYTLKPGEQKQTNVTNIAPDEALVVLVFDEEDSTYRAIKTLSCSNSIRGYRVTSQKGGPADWTMSTHAC